MFVGGGGVSGAHAGGPALGEGVGDDGGEDDGRDDAEEDAGPDRERRMARADVDEDDRARAEVARLEAAEARIVRARNTLELSEVWASEAMLDEMTRYASSPCG